MKDFRFLPLQTLLVCQIVIYVCAIYFNVDDKYILILNGTLPAVLIPMLWLIFYFRIKKDYYLLWCPLNWFFLSAGVAYGLGSLVWIYGNENAQIYLSKLYSIDGIELLRTNLLNCVTIFFVVLGYNFIDRYFTNYNNSIQSIEIKSADIKRFLVILLVLFLPFYLLIQLPRDYGFDGFELPQFAYIFGKFGFIIQLLLSYLWGKGEKKYMVFSLAFCLFLVLSQIPSFGKTAMLMPIVAATVGRYWGRPKVSVLLSGVVGLFVFLTLVAKPVADEGRAETYSRYVSLEERIELIYSVLADGDKTSTNLEMDELAGYEFLFRNSFNNVQAYQMNAFDNGYNGKSLESIFIAIVPRAIWPEKPNITNVGLEFDALVKGIVYTSSSLAPTFNGEAYWNGGWSALILVSFVIGMQFSHFTIFARRNLSNGDLRYFIVAIAGISYGMSIEAWIVPTFVGGYLTIWFGWALISRFVSWGAPRHRRTVLNHRTSSGTF